RSVLRMNSRTWTSPAEKLLLIRIGDDLPSRGPNDNARLATYRREHVWSQKNREQNTDFIRNFGICIFFAFSGQRGDRIDLLDIFGSSPWGRAASPRSPNAGPQGGTPCFLRNTLADANALRYDNENHFQKGWHMKRLLLI